MRCRKLLMVVVVVVCSLCSALLVGGRPGGGEMAAQWLDAVRKGDAPEAMRLAARLVGAAAGEREKMDYYGGVLAKEGIGAGFLKAGFNLWDFQLWSDAVYFHDRARALSRQAMSSDELIRNLATTVGSRISSDHDLNKLERAKDIWDRKFGLCDRKAWVVSELAYQLGFKTQIIYLIKDKKTLNSPHTICEIRSGPNVWLVDPFGRIVMPGKSFAVKKDADAYLAAAWDGCVIPRCHIDYCVYLTNSYAQDYCPKNQILFGVLNRALAGRCPRFGEDPVERRQAFARSLARAKADGLGNFEMWLWPVPLRALSRQMRDAELGARRVSLAPNRLKAGLTPL